MAGYVGERPYCGSTPRAGVYSITCRRTGRTYLGRADHLGAAVDGHLVKLASGRHPNPMMQADWDTYGGGAFDVSVHDEIASEDYAGSTGAELDALCDLWVDQLGLDEGRTY